MAIGDMSIEGEARISAIAGIDLAAWRHALAAPEELSIRTRGGSLSPRGSDWQSVVGVDEGRQGRAIGFLADIGITGPDQLIARHALA